MEGEFVKAQRTYSQGTRRKWSGRDIQRWLSMLWFKHLSFVAPMLHALLRFHSAPQRTRKLCPRPIEYQLACCISLRAHCTVADRLKDMTLGGRKHFSPWMNVTVKGRSFNFP